ncbi:NUDIX hydrolase [Falsirhodobacter deserti]|uniref:NUDIX hydrolase n=1 Tax=Falsirhodobacter deserti TaxID=1365611 RepID=UPI001F4E2C63|nr:NUDIX hydrolase [Falsirhodobacter deserti]
MKQDTIKLMDIAVRTQLGALCWRLKNGQPKILLITSRETGRWVLPKGWRMEDRDDASAAALEAWEEAGVTGELGQMAGRYRYDKVVSRRTSSQLAIPCEVEVYPLKVTSVAKRYPEHKQRRRKWFSPEKAAALVDEPDLAKLLRTFAVKDA